MQDTVTVETLSDVRKKISIKVSSDSVDKKFTEFFQSIKKDVQIPGFRKGNAPVSRLKQYYGHKARGDIAQLLISEFYTQAIKNYNLNPVSNPAVADGYVGSEYSGNFEFDNSYTIDLLVETLPEIDPVGYKNMELKFDTSDKDELLSIKMREYQEQYAERNQITDRGAELGDSLVIDFSGTLKGEVKPFPGGTAEGFSLDRLGEANFIPGFQEQVVGAEIDKEITIDVTFPEEYHAKQLAGKDAEFTVTVRSIVETKLAEIDDDLAMMVGYESVDELNQHINNEVDKILDIQNKKSLENQIVAGLLKANSFELPDSMVRTEKQRLLQSIAKNQQNIPKEALDALDNSAAYNVAKALIIEAIYEKEDDIEVTPAELDNMLGDHAKMNNATKDELVSILHRTNQMDAFVGVLRSSKVIDYIISSAKEQESENKDD